MTPWPLPFRTRAEPRILLVHKWRVLAWKTVLRKTTSLLWGGRMRITFSLKFMPLLFCLNFRDWRTDFLSTCRRWCQQCSQDLYLVSLGALALVTRQSRGLISYSDLFFEQHSLFRVQRSFMGNKLKERKLVLPYFSGWLFSNGLVKLFVAGGSHLWRHQKTDNLWSSCPKHNTGFYFRAQE